MKIEDIINEVYRNKIICVHSYNYQEAAEWRDIERFLSGMSIGFDVSVIFNRNNKDERFNKVYSSIKQLERLEKLKKLAKLQ